ncbi:hypothetical protein BL71B_04150 [Bifidobacterium longum subsp. longum 7-1B]|nr:hypothetical protein BL71B_04150 [Bifidobacterium longum subsp. longum 7-1B]
MYIGGFKISIQLIVGDIADICNTIAKMGHSLNNGIYIGSPIGWTEVSTAYNHQFDMLIVDF